MWVNGVQRVVLCSLFFTASMDLDNISDNIKPWPFKDY